MTFRHFLATDDWPDADILGLLDRALELKGGSAPRSLAGRVLVGVFFDPSLRTRTSFEVAMNRHRGHMVVLEPGRGSWAIETRPGVVMDGETVEHLIEAAGVFGTVSRMSLVSTTILTIDNQTLVVPNSKIWGDVIRNITAEPNRRVDMTFGIAYADDVDHAERVLWDIVKSNELVLHDPEPVIRLHALGESSVDFIVRPWARTSDYWTVYWDITRAVKKRFDEESISIPFPQRDVHVHTSAQQKPEIDAPETAQGESA